MPLLWTYGAVWPPLWFWRGSVYWVRQILSKIWWVSQLTFSDWKKFILIWEKKSSKLLKKIFEWILQKSTNQLGLIINCEKMSTCINEKLAYHNDATIQLQMDFPFKGRPVMLGLDADGETFVWLGNAKIGNFVLCFFTMVFNLVIWKF